MADESSDIDEVALNVLLAQGVDFPTASEASRRESRDVDSRAGSWIGLVIVLVVLIAVLFILFV